MNQSNMLLPCDAAKTELSTRPERSTRSRSTSPGKRAAYSSQIRVVRIGEPIPKVRLDTPELVSAYYRQHIVTGAGYDPEKEHLHVFALNTKYQIKGVNLVSVGSVNESIAHPREIFRPLIALAAYAFVVVHNHPSGDPTPSQADQNLTRRLSEVANLVQIRMLDHIIVGDTCFSFREAGIL